MNTLVRALSLIGLSCGLVVGEPAWADSPVVEQQSGKSPDERQIVQATFLVTGLHCPGCTRTVESALGRVGGVRRVNVEWKSKSARIEFDESVVSAQHIARLIAATPHMMSNDMHYGGWLALRVTEVENDESGKAVQTVLQKIAGVQSVATYPKQHVVGVQFAAKGQVTSGQLIEALTKAGFHAANL